MKFRTMLILAVITTAGAPLLQLGTPGFGRSDSIAWAVIVAGVFWGVIIAARFIDGTVSE
jgi:hypothetical protein